MPVCPVCSQSFADLVITEGVSRNLHHRKYCLNCSPFGTRNNRQLHKHRACLNCGELVGTKAKHCSNTCQAEYQYHAWIERWLVGLEDGIGSGGQTSTQIKRYLIQTRGERCENCGWNARHPVTGSVPITTHHLDGNSDNNRPENLRLLCPNEHSLTFTYGSLNRGNGRRRRT